MNRDDVDDLLALGAAGALSADEFRALDELLAADPELAAEYQNLKDTASALAEATSEAPPPALRGSILDAIATVEQLPAADPPLATAVPSLAPVPPARAEATVTPIGHRRRWMIPATAAAAVVMLLVGGLLVNRIADAPTEDQMAAVLNDDAATTIQLTGSLEGLHLVQSEEHDAAVLVGHDLARPDDGRVFQLWAIHDDQMIGMGTFAPAESGDVEMLIEDIDPQNQYAVTVEPEGGSDQPTSPPVAASSA